MNALETAWLAGLLEGEGTFGLVTFKGRTYPVVQLAMTDGDVVRRAAALMGSNVHGPDARGAYVTRRNGWPALDVMAAVRPLMGDRRGARIDELAASHRGKRRERPVASSTSES